jgi:hypothetical protein
LLKRTQAVSYWDTATLLLAPSEAVPRLPAYTVPAWPFWLNTDPGAEADAPGVTGLAGPQVFVGAPGWPVVGVTSANAVAPVNVIVATQKATAMTPLTNFCISTS